jgi:hypothetical protein
MVQTILALRAAVADIQNERKNDAYIHCHADQILLGISKFSLSNCQTSFKRTPKLKGHLFLVVMQILYELNLF